MKVWCLLVFSLSVNAVAQEAARERFEQSDYVRSIKEKLLSSEEFNALTDEDKVRRLEQALASIGRAKDLLEESQKVPAKDCCGWEYRLPKAMFGEMLFMSGLIGSVVNSGQVWDAFKGEEELRSFVKSQEREIIELAKKAEATLKADLGGVRSEFFIQSLKWLQRERKESKPGELNLFPHDEWFKKTMSRMAEELAALEIDLKTEESTLKDLETKGVRLGVPEARARLDARMESFLKLKLFHRMIAEQYIVHESFAEKLQKRIDMPVEMKQSARRSAVAAVVVPLILGIGGGVYAKYELQNSFVYVNEDEKDEVGAILNNLEGALKEALEKLQGGSN